MPEPVYPLPVLTLQIRTNLSRLPPYVSGSGKEEPIKLDILYYTRDVNRVFFPYMWTPVTHGSA